MSEMANTGVGQDSRGKPGESMHGVTGKESIFSLGGDMTSADTSGRFSLPVDSEHKAKKLKLFSIAQPHMAAFHLSWASFFTAFVSTFAAPPLIPIIRDNINLDKVSIGNAGIAAVSGAIFSRLVMGTVCDLLGPRFGCSFMLLLTAPAVFCMAAVSNAPGFIASRGVIGFSLATFVTCQFWMSSMFNSKIVGIANGTAAGWGNLGGGATQLLMPLLYTVIMKMGAESFEAWRYSYFVPGFMQVIMGFCVLAFGQDLPDGQYAALQKSGKKAKDTTSKVWWYALSNYRMWVFVLTYGYCFGVELTIDNIIAEYFYDKFDISLTKAGLIAASFGLMNIFSRPLGGVISDVVAARYGMRGRLWAHWLIQTAGGVMCIVLGTVHSIHSAIIVLLVFSFFVQAACGTTFGIIPFISRRSLGIISGFTGAGGNAGSALTQAVFFTAGSLSTEDGIKWTGVMICACTLPVIFVWFPMWGSMLTGPLKRTTATEENYYMGEFSQKEQEEGKGDASLRFAENAKSERGSTANTLPASTGTSPQADMVARV